MRTVRIAAVAIATAAATGSGSAQQPVAIRRIGAVVATAPEPFGSISSVRSFSNGSVLVNDGTKRRLLLFDSALTKSIVVADSTGATKNAYGVRAGSIIPYAGDSTLFFDPVALSMLVIDPSGKIARTASIPRAADINWLISTAWGAGFDGRGNLIYQSRLPLRLITGPNGQPTAAPTPDSAPIIRLSMSARTPDTATWLKLPHTPPSHTVRSADGKTQTFFQAMVPYRIADDWTLMADGSIAMIHAQDYHIDWISNTGERSSTPRVTFPWERLTEDDKSKQVDSLRLFYAQMTKSDDSAAKCRPPLPAGAIVTTFVYQAPAPEDLPDYLPAFYSGTAKSDADNNLWIREYLPKPVGDSGLVYDVINRKGELTDRIQIPVRTSLVGFGPGVAYLSIRDTIPKYPPPLPPPDPVTGCRPPGQPILLSQLPPIRLLRVRIH